MLWGTVYEIGHQEVVATDSPELPVLVWLTFYF